MRNKGWISSKYFPNVSVHWYIYVYHVSKKPGLSNQTQAKKTKFYKLFDEIIKITKTPLDICHIQVN